MSASSSAERAPNLKESRVLRLVPCWPFAAPLLAAPFFDGEGDDGKEGDRDREGEERTSEVPWPTTLSDDR